MYKISDSLHLCSDSKLRSAERATVTKGGSGAGSFRL